MMNGQYYQLVQSLDMMIQKVNKIQTLKLTWDLGKKFLGSEYVADMKNLESFGKYIDQFIETRQIFSQWVIQSDIFVTNAKFQKDTFLSRFVKQRNKVERELGKEKVNATKLSVNIVNLKTHFIAMQKYGKKNIEKIPKLKKVTPLKKEKIIILEKGKTVDILKQVSEIFNNSTKFLKIMDNWIGSRTLEYVTSVPEIPIKMLTSSIEKNSQLEFEILLKRINEKRVNPIEIHLCKPKEFHDRYAINGKDLWIIGASLKDAGYTNWTTISKISDEDQRKEISKIFDILWKNSIPFCP